MILSSSLEYVVAFPSAFALTLGLTMPEPSRRITPLASHVADTTPPLTSYFSPE